MTHPPQQLSYIVLLLLFYTKSIWLICIHFVAAIESIDIPRILSQQGGEAVYPLPKIKAIEFHPKSNLAALVFAVTCNLALFMSYFLVDNNMEYK
jgi:hypothetical protein